MHTERLYFSDPYLPHFSARVSARKRHGEAHMIALDQSAFYPESGGQPADHGVLNGIPVVDVQSDDGVVWHTLAAPLTDDQVRGEIDWGRRFDHMQQHHGQHLLSAAFEQLSHVQTVSFHLGTASSTVDLATATLPHDQVVAAEDLVNRIIWESRPVLARFVTAEELKTLPLRKPPVVKGPVRIVSVPDFDHSACGGTHPHTTGGVGLLHVRRWERRGETIRVEFLCGARALHDYRHRDGIVTRLATQASVGIDEIEATVERLREAEERSRKQLAKAQQQLIGYEALALIERAHIAGITRVVQHVFDNREMSDIRLLAQHIAENGCVALFGVRNGQRGQVLLASGPNAAVNCNRLLRDTLANFVGRGGGQAILAQGGIPDADRLAEVLDVAFAKIASGEALDLKDAKG
ncbi:MAG: alanyl-tRNA editing protein [Chloroflexi bacterium AL-W]|nr:alanyl-tRNA editing protein [Chloroflexi bacterium AL-N1]NOK68290.1 alanyl-tRNA editing protein [Chloroflexi bacterium AL-N10]NOK73936.1 alanyl-tRNA editing protein [Chloroflexi bacterium AL-N5]NOK82904.1 alanyl-tRNA editing protein [Chloroflexi bacterium AL-W]NOK90426.1 alanyl-tRNA editing protein [Chloroflexi bacterium AL-N15]